MATADDCLIVFRFDWKGECEFLNPGYVGQRLGKDQQTLLEGLLNHTCQAIRGFSLDLYYAVVGKKLRLLLASNLGQAIQLAPHELRLDRRLLEGASGAKSSRAEYLIGVLEGGLYHACNGDYHVSQVRHHSLRFYDAHPSICAATIAELESFKSDPQAAGWLEVLVNKDRILLLERFWEWMARQGLSPEVLKIGADLDGKKLGALKDYIRRQTGPFVQAQGPSSQATPKTFAGFEGLTDSGGAPVLVYSVGRRTVKAVRVRPSDRPDAMAAAATSTTIESGGVCTDIFHDHGPYIGPWLETLRTYARDRSLITLTRNLLCTDVLTVLQSIRALRERVYRKEHAHEAMRLLYAALYYWRHPDKGLSRSVCYQVSRLLTDVLTERPAVFPQSQTNRSVFKGDKAVVRVAVDRPYRIKASKIRARLQWSVHGHRKRTLPMRQIEEDGDGRVYFEIELPARRGWIHYAVQVSRDDGRRWAYEVLDSEAQGLLKFVADERNQRVLSLYADTFNLNLDESFSPVHDENGACVYGSFDQLADQLEAIKAEGYTRIYPLGALELGWAGEAGPDPSVFSIWDGRTVRRDMGGLEGLLRLKKQADELHMRVILCVLSHFSIANTDYPYRLPVYIANAQGHLVRRAGWDGEWDEWHDSFMVNMREFENVQHLAGICEELTALGFGLRIDVGHGFDTVFPTSPGQAPAAQLCGDVTLPGFEPSDLRGTDEANVPILYLCYRAQKANPSDCLFYCEQWHGNESRMIKSGTIPYNALIKNLENIRSGEEVDHALGLNANLAYLQEQYARCGGQTLSLFNSHDEESPASNYQNMIWPAAAFLVFSSQGPLMYHVSRLPGDPTATFRRRFEQAYLECWKHWANNRFGHPWLQEEQVRGQLVERYPLLKGFGAYLRGLFQIADENPALTRGTLVPIETHNGRIAAFLRAYGKHVVLCVFNFPASYHEGQQAVAREFNFALKEAGTGRDASDIDPNETYELKERYNNVEGRQRRGKREYWSGEELLTLGFGGVLSPVSSHVYEVIYRDHAVHEDLIMCDSFDRYFRYGKEDRVRHAFVAKTFADACRRKRDGFLRFSGLYTVMAQWLLKHPRLGIADLSIMLREISESDVAMRHRIIDYLMRVAVNEKGRFDDAVSRSAADVLRSINVGTIVLVSPESKFSGSSGGLGLYTTDIADVLSEMGFPVIIVTPLYECNRRQILEQYSPRYEGHSVSIRFPCFYDDSQSCGMEAGDDVINLYRTRLVRHKHGKRAIVNVFYLENAKYFDQPYGGYTAEDKIRRARMLSQGALEALRTYNIYPSVIQTNEWPSWLVAAYLYRWKMYRNEAHFAGTQVLSMMHNPHPSYSITLDEANPARREYYCRVLGFDPLRDRDMLFDRDSPSGCRLNLTHMMLTASPFIATVSRAMQERILAEPWVFGHGRLFRDKYENGRFFGRRNGFNMGARQRFWFSSKKSLLETYGRGAQRRLFARYTAIKKTAKINLQKDPCIRIAADDDRTDHVIFGMLHRICPQKGFELLVDWKVYDDDGGRQVRYEPWKMDGATVLEHFLRICPAAEFVICGRVEDSMDGRRFDAHLRRIAESPPFRGRLGYYPEGSLSPSLYRNLYLGCQFFVMPSGGRIGEPCGISQQEAHAAGTPVVAHHQDGLIRTVSDVDFGDTHCPANGVKFRGFTGESLLEALLDAVEIYTKGQRRTYKDARGRPKPLKYSNLSFNAFRTDHRWLRMLHDYAVMYAFIQNTPLPEHLRAVQLIARIASDPDETPATVILREGLTVADGVSELIGALNCKIPSVRTRAAETLKKLCKAQDMTYRVDITRHLRRVLDSENPEVRRVVGACLDLLKVSPSLRRAGETAGQPV